MTPDPLPPALAWLPAYFAMMDRYYARGQRFKRALRGQGVATLPEDKTTKRKQSTRTGGRGRG